MKLKFHSKQAIIRVLTLFHKAQLYFLGETGDYDKSFIDDDNISLVSHVACNNSSTYAIYLNLPRPILVGRRRYALPKHKLRITFEEDGSFISTRFDISHLTETRVSLHPHINSEGEPCLGQHERMMNFTVQNNSVKDIVKYASIFQNTWTRNDSYWDINYYYQDYTRAINNIEMSCSNAVLNKPALHQNISKCLELSKITFSEYILWSMSLKNKAQRVSEQLATANIRSLINNDSIDMQKLYSKRLEQGFNQSYQNLADDVLNVWAWFHRNDTQSNIYSKIESSWDEFSMVNFIKTCRLTSGPNTFNNFRHSNSSFKAKLERDFLNHFAGTPNYAKNSAEIRLDHSGLRKSLVQSLTQSSDFKISLYNTENSTLAKRKIAPPSQQKLTPIDKFAWVLINVFKIDYNKAGLLNGIDNINIINGEFVMNETNDLTYLPHAVGFVDKSNIESYAKCKDMNEVMMYMVTRYASQISRHLLSALVNLKILNMLGYEKNMKDMINGTIIFNNHSFVSNGNLFLHYSLKSVIDLYDWIETYFDNDKESKIDCILCTVESLTFEYNEYILGILNRITRRHKNVKETARNDRERIRLDTSNQGRNVEQGEIFSS